MQKVKTVRRTLDELHRQRQMQKSKTRKLIIKTKRQIIITIINQVVMHHCNNKIIWVKYCRRLMRKINKYNAMLSEKWRRVATHMYSKQGMRKIVIWNRDKLNNNSSKNKSSSNKSSRNYQPSSNNRSSSRRSMNTNMSNKANKTKVMTRVRKV